MNRSASEVIRNLEARVARLEGGRTAGSTPAIDAMIKNYTTIMSAENIKSVLIKTLMRKGYTAEEIGAMVIDTQKHGRALVTIGGDDSFSIEIHFDYVRGIPRIETYELNGNLYVGPRR